MNLGKIISSVALLLVLLLAPLSAYAAASFMPASYDPYPYPYSGTSQYYSVIYDNEQEAAVAAYITVQNPGPGNMTQLTMEIPGNNVRLVNAIQEFREASKYCSNWQDVCTSLSGDLCESYSRKCLSWSTNYYNSNPSYYSLDRSVEQLSFSAKYTVSLEKPVAEGETATLILYYKSSGTASESLGVSRFSFETVKIPYDTQTVRVAVNAQPDVRLKGSTSKVRSLPNFDMAASFASKGIESTELSTLSNSIRYQLGYVKQAYSLDPWESFVVKGSYSSSWLALYWPKLLMWVAIGAAAIVAAVLLISFIVRKLREGSRNILPKMLLAAFSGTMLSLFLLIISLVLLSISRFGYYGWPLSLLLLLFVFLLVFAALLGPSIYLGIRHGFAIGMVTFLITIITTIVLVVGLFFLLMLLSPPAVLYGIVSPMTAVVSSATGHLT